MPAKRAFTFIETVVALVLTSMFFIPAAGIVNSVARGFFTIRRNYYAAAYAKSILETQTLTGSEKYLARIVIETGGEISENASGAITAGYSPPVIIGEPNFGELPPETRETGGIKITERKTRKQNLNVVVDVYTTSSEFISRVLYVR